LENFLKEQLIYRKYLLNGKLTKAEREQLMYTEINEDIHPHLEEIFNNNTIIDSINEQFGIDLKFGDI
jgi:hypothetical protein